MTISKQWNVTKVVQTTHSITVYAEPGSWMKPNPKYTDEEVLSWTYLDQPDDVYINTYAADPDDDKFWVDEEGSLLFELPEGHDIPAPGSTLASTIWQ